MIISKQNSNLVICATIAILLIYSSILTAEPFEPSSIVTTNSAPKMAMMDDMGMGGASMPDKSMSPAPTSANIPNDSMPEASHSAMDMMGKMRGSMSSQRGMSKKVPSSSLPGFPGASHLYHIGASGFFLDHPQHISLSVTQQKSLNGIKEKSMLDQSDMDRRIEDAEQDLWVLTSVDSPNVVKIEGKIQAIEKLRSTQRMNFIRAVGGAAKVLTPEQRNALLGTEPASMQSPVRRTAPMSDM